jgi:cell division protein FtsW
MGKFSLKNSIGTTEKLNIRDFDYPIFSIIIFLSVLGLFFLYSASSSYAYLSKNDLGYYFKKQVIWFFLSMAVMLGISFVNLTRIRNYIPFLVIGIIILLAITLFMPKIQNARRWIPLKIMNLQTSEIAKVVFILYLSDYIDKNFSKIKQINYILKPILITSIILVLIAIEPDLGTPAIMFSVFIIVMFVGGTRAIYLITPLILAAILGIIEIKKHPYRLERLKVFLSPDIDPIGRGFQPLQSMIAIGSGWWFGRGPGNSIMKLSYLPQSHTDFIFPIVAEETGFLGVLIILILFYSFFKRTIKISMRAKNMFLSFLSFSSGLMIVIQAFFNIAMTGGMVPTKGLPLPFFSYGGSSIISTMILCGFILNASLRRKRL